MGSERGNLVFKQGADSAMQVLNSKRGAAWDRYMATVRLAEEEFEQAIKDTRACARTIDEEEKT